MFPLKIRLQIRNKKLQSANAEEDRKHKEEVEIKNNAASLVNSADRLLKDFEGKISDSDKTKLEQEKAALQKALDENKPGSEIKTLADQFQQTIFAISQAAYQQTAEQPQADAGASGQASDNQSSSGSDDDVIDAEFTKQ